MAQAPLTLGGYGDIGTKQIKFKAKHGKDYWRAWASFRDSSGERIPVDGYGPTENKAKSALRVKLDELVKHGMAKKTSTLSRDSKFAVAIDEWIKEKQGDDNVSEQTLDGYLKEIEPSTDSRASATTVKVRTALGGLYIREIDTQLLDAHLKALTDRGFKKKAKTHRIILSGISSMLVRRGVWKVNPMADIDRSNMRGKRGQKARPKAASWELLQGLRAQVARWADGEEVPGVPARDPATGGPRRERRLLIVADLLAGTGVRPWEVLAFRWCDVENYDRTFGVVDPVKPVRLTVCGTIVAVRGKPLARQEWTKTSSGYRVVVLPDFSVRALDAAREGWPRNDLDLILPTRKGTIWNPNNFNRCWRDARGLEGAGSEYAWITMRVYRKTVLTAIREAGGDARGQAGHRDDRVVDQYYYDKPQEAGDHRAILDAYRGQI